MNLKVIAGICLTALALTAAAADPTSTDYSFTQCEGSLTPYPTEVREVTCPDSLVPVFINHVGRHGSRYPASGANCFYLRNMLLYADSIGSITPLGRRLLALDEEIIRRSTGRWGALDSVGMAEQQAIASRMFMNYAEALGGDKVVKAISSYSPRSMMSMYSFTHQLDRLNNRLTFTTSTGRINSASMRPFDTDEDYLTFRREKVWEPAYKEYFDTHCPTRPAQALMGEGYRFPDEATARELSLTAYYVLAGCRAMGMPDVMDQYFTPSEANLLWSCFNLRQYLQRTATTVSRVPADIAAQLLMDIVNTTDAYVNGSDNITGAILRFGHAETLMPLFSLLKLPGCYYLTNYFDTVALHWRDFDVVPMAANLQLVVYRSTTGRFYVRINLNEKPLKLRKGDDAIYFPWGEVRRYMLDCVPLYLQ